MSIQPLRHRHTAADYCRFLLCAWLWAATTEFLLLNPSYRELSRVIALKKMSFLRLSLLSCAMFILQWFLGRYFDTTTGTRWCITGGFAILAIVALSTTFTWQLLGMCIVIASILAIYALRGWNAPPCTAQNSAPARPIWYWLTGAGAVAFFLFTAIWTVSRVYSLSTPAYDFGIFSQMFYYMKETGLPLTTIERDTLLSHFAVHVSPIYYLMLPFYWLFPHAATLQVLQAAILASAVIPLWKLCGHLGMTGKERMLMCALLLIYPAYAGGVSYDLHENCFLTPLLLWMFYGLVKGDTPLTFATALLTLTVKEDAAIYVAVAALWLLIRTLLQNRNKKNLLTAAGLLTLSVLWFFVTTTLLEKYGDGVMNNRYQNFMYPGADSLITVIQSVLVNPMKLLYECTSPEKVQFIGLTLLPLLGLPLLTRRYERYILLIPYILVNLMSDYPHQHQIFYQYSFGPAAFLFFLTAMNLAEWKIPKRRTLALMLAIMIALTGFVGLVVPKAATAPKQLLHNRTSVLAVRSILDEIPEEASVSATTYYACYLSQRKELYLLRYGTQEHILSSQYIVLNPELTDEYTNFVTSESENGLANLIALLESNGFEKVSELDNILMIYQRKDAV